MFTMLCDIKRGREPFVVGSEASTVTFPRPGRRRFTCKHGDSNGGLRDMRRTAEDLSFVTWRIDAQARTIADDLTN